MDEDKRFREREYEPWRSERDSRFRDRDRDREREEGNDETDWRRGGGPLKDEPKKIESWRPPCKYFNYTEFFCNEYI